MKPMRQQPKTARIIKNEEGSTGVLFALLAVPMFALLGMAVDYARGLNSRESMQQSLDAAVLAAANTSSQRALDAVTSYNRTVPANSQLAVTEANGKIVVAQAFFKANLKKVIANAQSKFSIQSDGTLRGQAWSDVITPVVGLVSKPKTTVVATAEARPKRDSVDETLSTDGSSATTETETVTPCLHVMDQNGSGAFTLDGNKNFNAGACRARVRSNHGLSAFLEKGSEDTTFASIKVKGYAHLESTGLSILSSPNKVQEKVRDSDVTSNPYDADMRRISQDIAVGACTDDVIDKKTKAVITPGNTNKVYENKTVSPGTYCGSVEFKNVTFSSGIYVIASKGSTAGALKMSGTLSGGQSGVTFVLADNKAYVAQYAGNDGTKLYAPTTGLTKGILFLDKSNRSPGGTWSISVCKSHEWKGMVYLPGTDVVMQGLENWKLDIGLSANRVTFKGLKDSELKPFSWTPSGLNTPITMEVEKVTGIKEGWLYR